MAGATILPDGQVALTLNAADLLRAALGRAPAPVLAQAFTVGTAAKKKRLPVADDSVTIRTLMKSILTVMGQDGVAGLAAVRKAGGRIAAQDEASSVVFGMPGAAISQGLADRVLPLAGIGEWLMAQVTGS